MRKLSWRSLATVAIVAMLLVVGGCECEECEVCEVCEPCPVCEQAENLGEGPGLPGPIIDIEPAGGNSLSFEYGGTAASPNAPEDYRLNEYFIGDLTGLGGAGIFDAIVGGIDYRANRIAITFDDERVLLGLRSSNASGQQGMIWFLRKDNLWRKMSPKNDGENLRNDIWDDVASTVVTYNNAGTQVTATLGSGNFTKVQVQTY